MHGVLLLYNIIAISFALVTCGPQSIFEVAERPTNLKSLDNLLCGL